MGIHRKSGRNMKKYLDLGPDLDWLAGQPVQILDEKSKSRACKYLDLLNLESGTALLCQKR
jgi:hypothetical protein